MPPINFVMQINGKQLAMRDKADLLIARLIIIVIFFYKICKCTILFRTPLRSSSRFFARWSCQWQCALYRWL